MSDNDKRNRGSIHIGDQEVKWMEEMSLRDFEDDYVREDSEVDENDDEYDDPIEDFDQDGDF